MNEYVALLCFWALLAAYWLCVLASGIRRSDLQNSFAVAMFIAAFLAAAGAGIFGYFYVIG